MIYLIADTLVEAQEIADTYRLGEEGDRWKWQPKDGTWPIRGW